MYFSSSTVGSSSTEAAAFLPRTGDLEGLGAFFAAPLLAGDFSAAGDFLAAGEARAGDLSAFLGGIMRLGASAIVGGPMRSSRGRARLQARCDAQLRTAAMQFSALLLQSAACMQPFCSGLTFTPALA